MGTFHILLSTVSSSAGSIIIGPSDCNYWVRAVTMRTSYALAPHSYRGSAGAIGARAGAAVGCCSWKRQSWY